MVILLKEQFSTCILRDWYIYILLLLIFSQFFVTLELSVQPLAGPSGGQADVQ